MRVQKALFLFFAMSLWSSGLFAQGIKSKSFWHSLVKKSAAESRSSASCAVVFARETAGLSHALSQAVRRAAVYAQQFPAYEPSAVRSQISRSLVQVISISSGGLASGGFVFEEFARGKRTLWAAVPYHVAGGEGHPVTLRIRGKDGSVQLHPLEVTVGGGWGRNAIDVSLIRLPETWAEQVFALRLSDHPVAPGSRLTAYGYTIKQHEPGRPLVVPQTAGVTAGFRLFGDGRLPEVRGGFCGSPVIGESGYVAGMHCASTGGEIFAITAAGIKELLRAYYFGRAEQTVFFFGHPVFDIASSESISRMTLERDGRVISAVDVQLYSGLFSYAEAERAFGGRSIFYRDVIRFHITEHGNTTRVVSFSVPEAK